MGFFYDTLSQYGLAFGYLVLLALVVAVAVQVVGVLLIFALLVTPAAIAQYLTSRPGMAVAIAVTLALSFTWPGLVVGYFTPYPVGFFITTFAFGAYVLVRGGWLVLDRMGRYRRSHHTKKMFNGDEGALCTPSSPLNMGFKKRGSV